MPDWKLKTPVAFLIFNRPDTTARVFEEIRKARPPKLLVVADGPRENRPGEAEQCAATRAVIEKVDWPCEVLKNYSSVNLGCKGRVSSGLDWVFDTVEEAIILEDDCLPDPTFFRFCETLLETYRGNERVMMISGDNFQSGRNRSGYSYYFSRFTHIWGWASWRRAWKHYDVTISKWPEVKKTGALKQLLSGPKSVRYWTKIFDRVYGGEINTWDYQWNFACLMQRGMAVMPEVNLISNIGFGSNSTHTTGSSPFSNMKTEAMRFPLVHPTSQLVHEAADDFTEKIMFSAPPLFVAIKQKLRQYMS